MRGATGERVLTADHGTALLVMDVQDSIVERLGSSELLERLTRAISLARHHGIQVIYVRVAFRPGYPEVSPRNASFSQLAGSGALIDADTSGVVLSTLRAAADMDYELTVLADCCADRDSEVHRVLLEKVFPRQAAVLTVAEWEKRLG